MRKKAFSYLMHGKEEWQGIIIADESLTTVDLSCHTNEYKGIKKQFNFVRFLVNRPDYYEEVDISESAFLNYLNADGKVIVREFIENGHDAPHELDWDNLGQWRDLLDYAARIFREDEDGKERENNGKQYK